LSPWSHQHADTNSKKHSIGLGSSHQASTVQKSTGNAAQGRHTGEIPVAYW
jgi:hypothetical protein